MSNCFGAFPESQTAGCLRLYWRESFMVYMSLNEAVHDNLWNWYRYRQASTTLCLKFWRSANRSYLEVRRRRVNNSDTVWGSVTTVFLRGDFFIVTAPCLLAALFFETNLASSIMTEVCGAFLMTLIVGVYVPEMQGRGGNGCRMNDR